MLIHFQKKTGANNEQGIYMGLVLRPFNHWKIASYVDSYRHPWLLFRTDAPSKGLDYLTRITYYLKRKLEIYLQVRSEVKDVNFTDSEAVIDPIIRSRIFRMRLHFSNKINKALEIRSRIYYGFLQEDTRQDGYAVYQDVVYKPIGFPLSFTARFALFDTPGYDVRFYAYENDLLYSFGVPAYYNKGTRFYINLRYKGIRNLTIEARFAQTYWSNKDQIGGTLDVIDGQIRSEVKAQIKYKF